MASKKFEMFKSVYRKPELAGWKGNFEGQTGFLGDRTYAEYHHPYPHPPPPPSVQYSMFINSPNRVFTINLHVQEK